jgi:uncharacterized protein (UPF0305 family)
LVDLVEQLEELKANYENEQDVESCELELAKVIRYVRRLAGARAVEELRVDILEYIGKYLPLVQAQPVATVETPLPCRFPPPEHPVQYGWYVAPGWREAA